MTIATTGIPFFKDSLLVWSLKIFGVRRIFHLHGKGISNELARSPFRRWYYNMIFKNAEVIHLAESLLVDIKDISTVKNMYVIPNGVRSTNKGNPHNGQVRLLYISNFFESKGALKLLKAAQILDKQNVNFQLKMVGGWPDINFKREILDYHRSIHWTNEIGILGPVYGQEKERIFQHADILVFPSTYELECFPSDNP